METVAQQRAGAQRSSTSPLSDGRHGHAEQVCRGDPSLFQSDVDCLSLCVSLAQRELGLPGRDCRTTKMRERDARAAIPANAAQIRLCVKTVIARWAQSAGTSGRICTAEKSKTRDASDTQFVAEREGFEPPIRLPVCRISSAVLSTTQPPLHRRSVKHPLRGYVSNARPLNKGARVGVRQASSRDRNCARSRPRPISTSLLLVWPSRASSSKENRLATRWKT